MDALERADQTLARAKARRDEIVTPDSATSPMDQTNTVQIPRALVDAADPRADPDSTVVIPAATDDPTAPAHFGPTRPVRPRR